MLTYEIDHPNFGKQIHENQLEHFVYVPNPDFIM